MLFIEPFPSIFIEEAPVHDGAEGGSVTVDVRGNPEHSVRDRQNLLAACIAGRMGGHS